MNLSKIVLKSDTDEFNLPLVGALPSDPYILKDVSGLGPSEVDVSMAETLFEGDIYQGHRPQGRQLVFRIGLNADYSTDKTVGDLREDLYSLFLYDELELPAIINLYRRGEFSVVQTTGYIEKFEIVPFSKTPEVQITFQCTYPYFGDTVLVEYENVANTHHLSKSAPVLVNPGSAPSGLAMDIIFTASRSIWSMTDRFGRVMKLDYNFVSGDKVHINTNPGDREITLTRAGVDKSLLLALSSDSVWHRLRRGNNPYTILDSTGFNWGSVITRPMYRGI